MVRFLFAFLLLASFASGENIALHKKATIHTPPNYKLSTDPLDAEQLTDGKSASGMWVSKEAVAWQNKRNVTITLDLEKVENIGVVRFSTAGRYAADVLWPSELCIFLSQDGKTWSYAGDVIAHNKEDGTFPEELKDNVLVQHTFTSRPLHTPARFIGIVARSTGKFLACDEIEVTASRQVQEQQSSTAETKNSEGIKEIKGIEGMEAVLEEILVFKGIQSRITADRQILKEKIANAPLDPEAKQTLQERLNKIPTSGYSPGTLHPDSFRSIFPLNEEHARLFEIQAELWRLSGATTPIATSFGRYNWLPHFHSFPTEKAQVEIKLLREEQRSAMLLLSNPRAEAVTFRIQRELPEEIIKHCTFYVSPWTDTLQKVAVADALLPLDAFSRISSNAEKHSENSITVPAGMSLKLWIRFNSHGVAAGKQEGSITLHAPDFEQSIPVKIEVSPVVLERAPLIISGWDYLLSGSFYGITSRNRENVMAFLKAHEIHTPWIASASLPNPKSNSTPQALETNFLTLANTLQKAWPEANYYLFFMNVPNAFADTDTGSEAFNQKVAEYIRSMEKAFTQAGIASEKILLLTVDEPYTEEKAVRSAAWAKAIASAKTGIRTFTDPSWRPGEFQSHPYMELADIVSPNIQCLHSPGDEEALTYFKQLAAEQNKELWFYTCTGPTRLIDPAAYYRLTPWFAFQHGAKGLGFWSFGSLGEAKSSWNEYLATGIAHVPYFLGTDRVDTSIHWEALMEGRLDYSLFQMLKNATTEQPNEEITSLFKELATQLERIPKYKGGEIFTEGYWEENTDNQPIDNIRLQAIQILESL